MRCVPELEDLTCQGSSVGSDEAIRQLLGAAPPSLSRFALEDCYLSGSPLQILAEEKLAPGLPVMELNINLESDERGDGKSVGSQVCALLQIRVCSYVRAFASGRRPLSALSFARARRFADCIFRIALNLRHWNLPCAPSSAATLTACPSCLIDLT